MADDPGRQLELLQHLPGESRRERAARSARQAEPQLAELRCLQRLSWEEAAGSKQIAEG